MMREASKEMWRYGLGRISDDDILDNIKVMLEGYVGDPFDTTTVEGIRKSISNILRDSRIQFYGSIAGGCKIVNVGNDIVVTLPIDMKGRICDSGLQ